MRSLKTVRLFAICIVSSGFGCTAPSTTAQNSAAVADPDVSSSEGESEAEGVVTCEEANYSQEQYAEAFVAARDELAAQGYEVTPLTMEDDDGYSRLVDQMITQFGCTLQDQSSRRFGGDSCERVEDLSRYQGDVAYCGPGARREPCGWRVIPGDCLNRVCYRHDICYGNLITQHGQVCIWSPDTDYCDEGFYAGAHDCARDIDCGFRCMLITTIAAQIKLQQKAVGTVSNACLWGLDADEDADGYSPLDGDCDDHNATVHIDASELCDGLDNNCNGVVDEGFVDVGNACTVGRGVCMRSDLWSCSDDHLSVICPAISILALPSPEICNGQDDDCDGVVDNGVLNACGGCGSVPVEVCNGLDDDCDGQVDEGSIPCPLGMVGVNLCFCMDAYEASRPHATADWNEWPGFGVPDDGVPESVSGVRPWQLVTWGGAQAACERAGKRLCLGSEWRTACAGTLAWNYPYGDSYNPAICNGWEDPVDGPATTGSFQECRTPSGIYDLSGNVSEWVRNDLSDATDMGRLGASYVDDGNIFLLGCDVLPFPVAGASCASETVEVDPVTDVPVCGSVADNVGFRCCF